MALSKISFSWQEEGDGWVGRWETSDGEYGAYDLEIFPEGGLHGAWAWETPWGQGGGCTAEEAEERAEALVRAVFG
jgi:hypothetical protein